MKPGAVQVLDRADRRISQALLNLPSVSTFAFYVARAGSNPAGHNP